MSKRSTQDGLKTGRPLADGEPIASESLRLDADGPAARRLQETSRPLVSSPGSGTWATLLEDPRDDDVEHPRLLQWLTPDAPTPPGHTHPTTETFRGVERTLTLVVDGESRRLDPGEEVTVPPGTPHTFRNDAEGVIAFEGTPPSMRTVRVLYNIWGLDHEGAFSDDGFGEPGPIHGLLAADALRGETNMKTPPVPVQRLLSVTVVPVLRRMGYSVTDDWFLDERFWKRHVEQPE